VKSVARIEPWAQAGGRGAGAFGRSGNHPAVTVPPSAAPATLNRISGSRECRDSGVLSACYTPETGAQRYRRRLQAKSLRADELVCKMTVGTRS
jgi:hypothetical protein